MQLVSVREQLTSNGLYIPPFDLFSGRSVSVIQWQPHGIFDNDFSRVIRNTDSLHSFKARQFIDIAHDEYCSLVLTAEYSFPYKIFCEIIREQSKWPKFGAIWCLSMEGIGTEEFKQLIHSFSDNIIIINREEGLNRRFVAAISYLFVVRDGECNKLCVIFQHKTHSSSDKYSEHESASMCFGDTIYYFSDDKADATFLSFICSDSYNQYNLDLLYQFTNKNLLLFNPQLNFSFLHQAETRFFQGVFDNREMHTVIIALNWAEGTKVINEPGRIEHGYSAILRKPSTEIDVSAIVNNYRNGVCFGQTDYIDVWYTSSSEQILQYQISSLIFLPAHSATTKTYEPMMKKYYSYSDGWIKSIPECQIDWGWFLNSFSDCEVVNHQCLDNCGVLNGNRNCMGTDDIMCCYKDIATFCNSFYVKDHINPFSMDRYGLGGAHLRIPDTFEVKNLDYNRVQEKKGIMVGIAQTAYQEHRLPKYYREYSHSRKWLIGERTRNIRYFKTEEDFTDAWIVFVPKKNDVLNARKAINKQYKSDDEFPIRNRVLICYNDPQSGYQYSDTKEAVDIRYGEMWVSDDINREGAME